MIHHGFKDKKSLIRMIENDPKEKKNEEITGLEDENEMFEAD